jgi:hypothetical protein
VAVVELQLDLSQHFATSSRTDLTILDYWKGNRTCQAWSLYQKTLPHSGTLTYRTSLIAISVAQMCHGNEHQQDQRWRWRKCTTLQRAGGRSEDQLYRCLAVFSCNIAIIRCQRFAAAQLKP